MMQYERFYIVKCKHCGVPILYTEEDIKLKNELHEHSGSRFCATYDVLFCPVCNTILAADREKFLQVEDKPL